jgi:hypothetical protein
MMELRFPNNIESACVHLILNAMAISAAPLVSDANSAV